jgi:multiple sugar transport system permease protein
MLPTIFVFYWMITLSLKPQVEATAYPPSFVRFSVTTAGYREVFTKYPFFLYTWNSLVVATGCTLLGLAVGMPAAYSIATGGSSGWPSSSWSRESFRGSPT